MGKKDPRVDAYIDKSADFAKPILNHFRKLIHNTEEYLEWINGAKTEETRKSRLETAIEWMAEGKSRHWKYAARK